ncbi:hypothetical protein KP509_28G009200 [Ceratopteris richardii]|uniref:Uncharacterized protein n=1 Tax=Ceratopteris richardii TaxID=49495 RepID=A0A8T2RB93_CERRI|nr:hypothetical protein KP509_28G009200 [Ceratopteris richardii]
MALFPNGGLLYLLTLLPNGLILPPNGFILHKNISTILDSIFTSLLVLYRVENLAHGLDAYTRSYSSLGQLFVKNHVECSHDSAQTSQRFHEYTFSLNPSTIEEERTRELHLLCQNSLCISIGLLRKPCASVPMGFMLVIYV